MPAAIGHIPRAAAAGRCFGLLTALCFALWPLGRAARIPGAALFRDLIVPEHSRPHAWVIAVNALVAAGLVGVTVASAADRRFALYFCVAALATLGCSGWRRRWSCALARLAPVSRMALDPAGRRQSLPARRADSLLLLRSGWACRRWPRSR